MNRSSSRSTRTVQAVSRRAASAARHETEQARHAAYRADVAVYEAAYDAWATTGIGPEPIHPANTRAARAQRERDLNRLLAA